ncbi:helix-turn-helix domain-containing protein [Intestinimonas butyriciproducens]|uniref:helix-turn-helix domain-containing protein n=1 Tax=Intestinimonas butyriciproducens TaxID=1297617 RepID=UPI0019594EAE|nr:helix-turn-helix transcriptional regulator [Intestinimonas butyriciproducens]
MSKKDGQITERLGSILRELREEKGLTREELAERSETGLRHVAAIELGEKNPSVDTLYRLIRGIGVSSDRVFYPELSQNDPEFEVLVHTLAVCSSKQKRLVLAFVEMLRNQEDLIEK